MADKILKSITFPNLPDKYIIPETTVDSAPTQGSNNAVRSGGVYEALQNIDVTTDTTLSVPGKPADAKVVGDEIEGIKGDLSYLSEQYDVVSRNLFNKELVTWGKGINSAGNIVDKSAVNWISKPIYVEASTAYYANRNGALYTLDGTFIELHSISGGTSFTTPSNASYLIIASNNDLLDTTMVAKGSGGAYDNYQIAIKKELVRVDTGLNTPGTPADSKAVGDKIQETKNGIMETVDSVLDAEFTTSTITGELLVIDDSAIDSVKNITTGATKVYASGINLWDEQWESGRYATDGVPTASATNIRSKNTNPIPVHPDTDYYIKSPQNAGVMFYDATDTFISYTTGFNKKITTPANAYYMRFYLVSGYGTTYNNDIQWAFNSEPEKTTYHAHRNNQFTDFDSFKIAPKTRNYIYAIGTSDSISLTYYKQEAYTYIAKKPYQSGFITFTVPSRLTKSNNSVSASSVSELADDSVDVNCILKLPSTYTPNGNPTKLIMICHGAGQSAESWATNTNYIALVNAFTSAGYAVFDCNGYRENALGYSFWGDSRGVDVWRKAYQYVVDNYNVEQVFGLYGFSMGGLTALNLAFSGFPGIKCIALGSPVVSLEACYNSESVNAVIKVLYGMGNTYDPALAYGCDPYARIITINNQKYIFGTIPPIKMWYGSTETGTTDTGTGETVTGVVVKAYGEDIVEAINNAGGQAEYREVDGAGHEICYGGNPAVNNDLVLYFDRHNKI